MAPISAAERRRQQIEALKDRFVRHCTAGAATKSPKGPEHVKLKIKKAEEDSQGVEHLVEEEVDYVRTPLLTQGEEDARLTSPRTANHPGASRRQLQASLLEQIRNKKLKEHEERMKLHRMDNEEDLEEILEDDGDYDDEDEEEDNEDDEENEEGEKKESESEEESAEEEEELEEDDIPMVDEKKERSAFVEDEAEEDEEEEGNTAAKEESESESEEEEDATPASSQKAEDKPDLTPTSPPKVEENEDKFAVPEALAELISEPKAALEDAVELCSGRFATQAPETGESQEDEFAGFDFGDNDDAALLETAEELEKKEEEEVKEEETAAATPTTKANTSATVLDTPKLPGSLEDDDDDEDPIERRRSTGIMKMRRLQFSDDEDDGEDDKAEEIQSSAEEDEEDEEMEEEEVPVPVVNNPFFNKFGKLKKKFVEDEAELSGSDEASDDEDEKGLNHYEEEEGEEEILDEDEVKDQVGRVHLEQLLDEDDQQIRFLQNHLLEDGDLHSEREREKRKFKWNFSDINDDALFGADSDPEELDQDTPEEASQKKAWIEKRKWISENSHLIEAAETESESQSLLSNSRFLNLSRKTIQKLEARMTSNNETTPEETTFATATTFQKRRSIYEEIIKTKSEAKLQNSSEISVCSEGSESQSQSLLFASSSGGSGNRGGLALARKGSFLSRGGAMLAKLADGMKPPGETVSNVKGNHRNFVFQHVTPPQVKPEGGSSTRVKRGAASKAENAVKRQKVKDRSFSSLDEKSKGASIFNWL